MRIISIFILALALSCNSVKIPTEIKANFQKSFPGVTGEEWSEDDGKYEAAFKVDGKEVTATYTPAGVLEETETKIPIADLPKEIEPYIKSKYPGMAIKEASIVERGTNRMFEAEIEGKELLFNEAGGFLFEEKD